MTVTMEFEIPKAGISAPRLARLFLDIQHLHLMMVALAEPEKLSVKSPSLDPWHWSYKGMSEVQDSTLGTGLLTITALRMESPLVVKGLLNVSRTVASVVAKNLATIRDRIFYGDIERKKRLLELDEKEQDIIAKRIANASAVLDLEEKIQNSRLRRTLEEGLHAALRPFLSDHPPTSIDIQEEDK